MRVDTDTCLQHPLPLPLRICLGNVLLTVAQRCPVTRIDSSPSGCGPGLSTSTSGDGGAAAADTTTCALHAFALQVIPAIAPCAAGLSLPSMERPPLVLRCAALRLVITSWVRLQQPVGLSIADAHGLALNALRDTTPDGGGCAHEATVVGAEVGPEQVRLCGLKLLGAVLSITQRQTRGGTGSGLIAHLPPGALLQTRTALQSAANMDASRELRSLAQELLRVAFATEPD